MLYTLNRCSILFVNCISIKQGEKTVEGSSDKEKFLNGVALKLSPNDEGEGDGDVLSAK